MKSFYYLIKNLKALKSLKMLYILLVLCISSQVQGQITDSSKTIENTTKKENLIDMQAESLTGTFGENLDGKPTGKALSYLEILDTVDLPEKQKAEYVNWYYLHAKELTQKQKDSLGKAIEKKVMEAKKD